jgi:hypothetical protein
LHYNKSYYFNAGDIKLLKTKTKVTAVKEMQNPLPLNPDPDSKKVYLNKDGSGVVVTLLFHSY